MLHLLIGASRAVLGDTSAAFLAVPYLAAMLAAFGTFLLVSWLTEPRAGLVAVVGVVSLTTFQRDISVLTPDWSASALIVLSVALLVRALQSDAVRSARLLALLSGLLVGAAFGITEQSVYAIVGLGTACTAFLIQKPRQSRPVPLLWMAGGILGFVIDMGASWYFSGNPLGRIRTLIGEGSFLGRRIEGTLVRAASPVPVALPTDPGLEGAPVTWPYLVTRYLDLIWSSFSGKLLLTAFIVALAFALRSDRRREVWLVLTVAVAALAGASIAVTGFDPPTPLLRRNERYLAPTLPLLVAFTTVGLHRGAQLLRTVQGSSVQSKVRLDRLVLPGFAVMILAAGLVDTSFDPRFMRNGDTAMTDTAALVAATDGPLRIWADFRTAQAIHLFLDEADRTRVSYTLNFADDLAARPETDLAVLNLKRFACGTDRRGSCVKPVPIDALWIDPTLQLIESGYPFSDIRLAVPRASGPALAYEWRTLDIPFTALIPSRKVGTVRDQGDGTFLLSGASDVRFVLGEGDGRRSPSRSDALNINGSERALLAVKVGWGPDLWVRRVEVRAYGVDGRLEDRSRLYVMTSDGEHATFGGLISTVGISTIGIYGIVAGDGLVEFSGASVAEMTELP